MVMQASGGVLNHGSIISKSNGGSENTVVVSSKKHESVNPENDSDSDAGVQGGTSENECTDSIILSPEYGAQPWPKGYCWEGKALEAPLQDYKTRLL
ncbi:unnamed protein product [Urochloa humidicola]